LRSEELAEIQRAGQLDAFQCPSFVLCVCHVIGQRELAEKETRVQVRQRCVLVEREWAEVEFAVLGGESMDACDGILLPMIQ
jgi:hypothetical protein